MNKLEYTDLKEFRNEPYILNVKDENVLKEIKKAKERVAKELGREYPLYINGKELRTEQKLKSINPANPEEIVGFVCQAGRTQAEDAVSSAKNAYLKWRDTSVNERAWYLIEMAKILRNDIYYYCAWQVLEIGKQWDQAFADVAEAIDFLEYYAREMFRLSKPQVMMSYLEKENNIYFYEPKGVALVIAPWNFPHAISIGMVAASIITGNTVVYKPSGLTSIIGYHIVELCKKVGLPDGVFNFVPGSGREIGDYLVEHKDVNLIAFTGSMEIGLRIIERAGRTDKEQEYVKKVVCEMGGKNAIIVDEDADIELAVPKILYAAFAFQGQKCSACSRLIVHEAIYNRLVEKLIEEARNLKVGPASELDNYMGAVADENAYKTIKNYIEIGKEEGKLLFESEVPKGRGYFVPMTIIENITPQSRIAQEEIFGPVLAVMKVKDFSEALVWANSTRFALTGGVFSNNKENLLRAVREFRVGNLYLNRHNTGALVGRQPFGGAKMSGVGTKAGGPDYLLHFLDPRSVTEQFINQEVGLVTKK